MSRTAHVIPLNDLVRHEMSEDCVCGPTPRLVPPDDPPWTPFDDDDGDRWVVVHYALDGRALPK